MILDMDGVLYKNSGVENDIVKQLGKATELLGLEPEAHQRLFQSYGSTVQGLLREGHLSGEAMQDFYSKVYDGVNLEALRPDPLMALQLQQLRADNVNLWLATNSPRSFVDRVLKALQIDGDLLRIVCPSPENGWVNKPDARFFETLPRTSNARFFDDSFGHVRAAVAAGLPAAHVKRSDDVMTLVADALLVVPSCWRLSKSHYLQAKERADLRALAGDVQARLAVELASRGRQISVLDLGAGTLSMLSVILQALPEGCRVKYTAVDRDEVLLKQAAVERSSESDAIEALETVPPQTLIVGFLAANLQDAGALLYFPIHYAGVTVFQSTRDVEMELLTRDYNRSLECRGQVTNVTSFYKTLGETIATGASPWILDSKVGPDLMKQLISFMAVNALGFHGHTEVAKAVAALQGPDDLAEDVVLKVENVDYLGQVPDASHVAPQRLVVEFSGPGKVHLAARCFQYQGSRSWCLVLELWLRISAGTERRMLMHGPGLEPLDVAHAYGQTSWPFRYGYCIVGIVLDSESADRSPGDRVFCFHPHASHAVVRLPAIKEIPSDISDEDAVFFANMETACALCQDAAPVIGESIAIFGAGTVGALTAAVLAHHGHAVTVFDTRAERVTALQQRFPTVCSEGDDFDICIEVSGSQDALASAIQLCRRGGTVVLGSLYEESVTSLPLGLRFHRSEISMKASQVSRIPAQLSTRWDKERRSSLAWSFIRELRPKEWIDLTFVPVSTAPAVYQELIGSGKVGGSDSSPQQRIFTYNDK
ncbi:tdh [Symbiodinium pilosum]|uniref:Tdh protein n=1 Tax=Symbiodinium pilosum TaxID=2952 RepID=A0A812Q0F4_SYMPI|nr:tdh [Symbiodinium pilosum]